MKRFRARASIAFLAALVSAAIAPGTSSFAASPHKILNCAQGRVLCTEVQDPEEVFGEGHYVGHDEPAALFYSSQSGSGNQMRYRLTLPNDPPAAPGNTFNFQLHPAFWFGMAMCDVQSYPEQVSTCTPDSDTNIKPLDQHAGAGFMELQFYPPGWVLSPSGNSCDARQWCVAMVTFGLAEDPIAGTLLNSTCANITGIEYANFAFLTRSGTPQPNSPPNPVQSTLQTFTPDPNADLFMNSGDRLNVTLHDSAHGLFIGVDDLTTGQAGSMTAAAANGFGSPRYAPHGDSCKLVPLDFHPMYSTSSEQTRVIWAAHSYNITFTDEIGHFDYCSSVTSTGGCAGTEGSATDLEASDGDDGGCFDASQSSFYKISGCAGTNTGFDGVPYQAVWPDGNPAHPSPVLFSSPLTGTSYGQEYDRTGFEADLPRIEAADFGGSCNRSTGAGCTIIPPTDDGAPATFYPFFSTIQQHDQCSWTIGNDIPDLTTNDFGGNGQYGQLLFLNYLKFGGGGTEVTRTNDYRQVFDSTLCPAGSGD